MESQCIDADVAAAFLAGAMAAGDARRIEEHVDTCADCRRLLGAAAESSTDGNAADADAAVLAPGTRVGRYVVERPLGVGAMGVVVGAHDPELGRRVALKRVRVDVPEVDAWQERLRREARAMARLSHPNVVAVYDLVVHEQRLFIAMELIDGESLSAWLAEAPRGWREIVDAFVQAGRGLAAAHAVGLVHRDFKPGNVLRSRDGRVCVSDFGLARPFAPARAVERAAAPPGDPGSMEGSLTHGRIAGTPAYMAPEQVRGEPADARSDQFSFCVALYEALYGERPLREGRAPALSARAGTAPPPWIGKALLRGLRESPAERHPSMQALLATLTPDRRATRLRAIAAVGMLLAVACVLLAYRRGRAADAAICRGAPARLAGVWDSARSDAVRDAMLGTHKPYAADLWRGVQQTLDRYASAWASTYVNACEATQVRREQSSEAMDLRMACLGDRLDEMRAAVDVLAHTDEGVVSHARSVADALTPVVACNNVAALRARSKPPSDPAVAARVETLWSDLRRAKAMALAGKVREALPIAASASKEADVLGDTALQAEASYRYGGLEGMTGDLAHAGPELLRAARFADAAGDDRIRAEVCRMLLYNAGREGKPDLIPVLEEQARAAIDREGGDPQAEARLLVSLAGAQVELGHYGDAKRTGDEAVVLAERAFGDGGRVVSEALTNRGIAEAKLGATDDAFRDHERAWRIFTSQLGEDHPDAAALESNMGDALLLGHEPAAAEPHFRRAIDVATAGLGPDHFRVGRYLEGLAETFLERGRFAEAEGPYRRALAISEKSLGADHPRLAEPLWGLGEALMGTGHPRDAVGPLERAVRLPPSDDVTVTARAKLALARALLATGGSGPRARRLVEEARDRLEGAPAYPRVTALLADARAWLEAHPSGRVGPS